MAARKKRALTAEEQLEAALVPEEEWPYELPDNWCWVRISSGFEVASSKRVHKQDWLTEGIPFYRTRELVKLSEDGHVDNELFISKEQYQQFVSAYGRPQIGDLLISGVGTIGVPYIVASDEPFYFKDGNIIWFKNRGLFLPEYVYFAYKSVFMQNQIHAMSAGTTVDTYTIINANRTLMPLPPLHEQRRIASRIEWLFAKLDDAEAKLRDVINSSEQRQATILCQALNGGVTKSWRVRNGVDRAATWKECRLIDALKGKPRNGYSPKPVDYETPVKNLVLTAVTSGTFKSEYFKYIDEEIPDDSHLWLTPGDILLQRSNSLEKVGTSALYTGKPREFVYPDLMMKLQANDTAYAPFIAYQLKSFGVMNYLRSNATGTAGNMPKVNQVTVSNIPIVLPSYQEQVEIAESLDYLLSREMALVDDVSAVLDDLKNMRMIILSRALRGELGTNDPDEPSSKELLASVFERET